MLIQTYSEGQNHARAISDQNPDRRQVTVIWAILATELRTSGDNLIKLFVSNLRIFVGSVCPWLAFPA